VKLSADEGDHVEDTTMYKRIVGSLIYMTITRPDLSYTIVVVSQFMQASRKPHLDAMRRILRYIKHNLHCGIFYEAKSQLQVHGYMDADWVGNVLDKRSTSGFMFFLEVITSVAYYLLTTRSIMLGQSTLRCTITLLKNKL
jgi:hypothetical protein